MKKILSQKQKNADDKEWYKETARSLDVGTTSEMVINSNIKRLQNIKIHQDLYENKLNIKDLEYVLKPYNFGDDKELPIKISNKDIISGKIKAVLGMESKKALTWRAIGVNPEATSRRQEEELNLLKSWVEGQIVGPIREQAEIEAFINLEGREPTEEEMQQIQAEIEATIEQRTPEEIKVYMAREHKDPAEFRATHLLNYHLRKLHIRNIFEKVTEDALVKGEGVAYVGVVNEEPQVWRVKPENIRYDNGVDSMFIQDSRWAVAEYFMKPSEIFALFKNDKDFKEEYAHRIYESWGAGSYSYSDEEDLFHLIDNTVNAHVKRSPNIVHCVWEDYRKIGDLTYYNEFGEIETTEVDEEYEFDELLGDISISWRYVPELHETWIIKTPDPIYLGMGPVQGQYRDPDNPYKCELPYKGIKIMGLVERLKNFQYLFNIIFHRIEVLTASDKGKKFLMDIENVPRKQSLGTWTYYFESSPFVWYSSDSASVGMTDANNVGKVLDMSLASDIAKYQNMLEYVRIQAGKSVGITEPVEGQVGPREAVGNTKQNLVQSSNILEPYFSAVNYLKQVILNSLLNVANVAYSTKEPVKLSYVTDDMVIKSFDTDSANFDNEVIGIFVENTAKLEAIEEDLKNLAFTALQSQKIELSDVLAAIEVDSYKEAKETLKKAEMARIELESQIRREEQENAQELMRMEEESKDRDHERAKEIVILKEEQRRETIIQQTALTGMSFNPELDQNRNRVNDFLEIARHGIDADIKTRKQNLEEDKFNHTREKDEKEIELKNKQLELEKKKLTNKNKPNI